MCKEATKFILVSEFQGKHDFFMLRNALRNHFSPREISSVLRVSLRHRKRKSNECLVKLERELRLLPSRTYPAAHADMVDDIARDAFTDALDNVAKEKVLDADPANLEAAQRKALLVKANIKKNATARAAAAAELAAYTPTSTHIAQTKIELGDAFTFCSSKHHCCMVVMLSALASP